MTATTPTDGWAPAAHPVLAFLGQVDEDLDKLVDTPIWAMSQSDLRAALVLATKVESRVAELGMRLAVGADEADLKAGNASASTGAWWASETQLTKQVAVRRFKTAQALDGDRSRVREALAAGDLLLDQAGVIVRAVEALTSGVAKDLVDAETVATAEEKLLELAKVHDAKALTVLGRRILDVVAPEIGEAHEARVLDAEERLAEEGIRLTIREDERGRLQGRFTIPSMSGAMFKKHLMALASPAGKKIEGDRSESFSPKRMGQAFVAYIERYPVAKLPTSGGLAATMAITVSHDTLVSALGAARLDTGQHISPALARMAACEAGILPVVMGGKSEVLDVGRKRRSHTRAMRIRTRAWQGRAAGAGDTSAPARRAARSP
jgi:hypothetical protein